MNATLSTDYKFSAFCTMAEKYNIPKKIKCKGKTNQKTGRFGLRPAFHFHKSEKLTVSYQLKANG
jgi:hypothetical protein